MAVVPTVLVGGKPAVVVGCSGMNVPPHVGLHPADPFFTPAMQVGRVVAGSVRVLIGGKPAATQAGSYTCCGTPGQVVASGTTVLIG
jgi:uncharacterized Zn-binding protein involved in type VI secretion